MRDRKVLVWIVSALMLTLYFATSINFIRIDKADLRHLDAGGHALHALRIYHFIKAPSSTTWERMSGEVSYYYPPLTQTLGALSFFLFSRSGDTLILVSLILFGTLIFFACNRLEGVLAEDKGSTPISGFLCLVMPGLVNLSRKYYLDFPLTAMVCVGVLFLVLAEDFKSRKWSILWGAAVGLGMLTKITYPIYLVGPLAIVLPKAINEKDKVFNLLRGLLVSIIIAAPWYVLNLPRIIQNYLNRVVPDAALGGTSEVFTSSSLAFYPLHIYHYALGHIMTVALAAGILLYILFHRKFSKYFWICAAWFFVSLVLLVLLKSKSFRFIMPALPPTILVFSMSVNALSKASRAFVKVIIVGFFAVLFLANFKGDRNLIDKHYPIWPPAEDWKVSKIADDIMDDYGLPIIYMAILPSLDEFYSEIFQFQFETKGFTLDDRGVPYRVRTEPDFWEIVLSAELDYILTKTGSVEELPYPFAENIKLLTEEPIEDFAYRYKIIKTYPLPDGSSAILYKSKTALSRSEVVLGSIPPQFKKFPLATFENKIELIGVDQNYVCGGEEGEKRCNLKLDFYWKCTGRIRENYKIFVHIERVGDDHSVGADHYPVKGRYPTGYWSVGEVMKDEVEVALDAGEYDILAGIFEESTGRQLRVHERDVVRDAERVFISKIRLE